MEQYSSSSSGRLTGSAPWPALKLYIREAGRQSFNSRDLVYLQAETNYSWLQWANGQRLLMPRTLKYYMSKLPESCFIRLHRNCIVNRQFISRLERTDAGGVVHLTVGGTLPVSRRRWVAVNRQIYYS